MSKLFYLEANDVSNAFIKIIHTIFRHGEKVSPRGMDTLELAPAAIAIENPRRRILNVKGRVMNFPFAVAEAVWVLSGSDANWIFDYNKNLLKYADDGVLRGAYGPRIRHWGTGDLDQLDYARTKLLEDCSSRQAVLQVWDPQQDTRLHKDVACTLNYRFLIRNGKLNLHSHMRSQDVWLGFPYDMFTITLLQELMAGWLDVEIGRCECYVDSLHLYQRDRFKAEGIAEAESLPGPPSAAVPWVRFDAVLRDVLKEWEVLPPFWRNCGAVLSSYLAWRASDGARARALASDICAWARDPLLRWYEILEQQPPEKRNNAELDPSKDDS